MTWLSSMQKKFTQEEAAKVEREQREAEAAKERLSSASNELVRFIETHLQDLVGKKTKNGEVLRMELDKNRSCATMYIGDKPLVTLSFYYWENESYDSDGCSWGDGTYYLKKLASYHQPYKDKGGHNVEKTYKDLYEEDLAHYLLQFIDMN